MLIQGKMVDGLSPKDFADMLSVGADKVIVPEETLVKTIDVHEALTVFHIGSHTLAFGIRKEENGTLRMFNIEDSRLEALKIATGNNQDGSRNGEVYEIMSYDAIFDKVKFIHFIVNNQEKAGFEESKFYYEYELVETITIPSVESVIQVTPNDLYSTIFAARRVKGGSEFEIGQEYTRAIDNESAPNKSVLKRD